MRLASFCMNAPNARSSSPPSAPTPNVWMRTRLKRLSVSIYVRIASAGMYFRAVHVFDVSQTEGPDLPSVDVPDVAESADTLLAELVRVANERNIRVVFAKLSDGLYGVSKGGVVEVSNEHPTGQQAKTLAHELAHEALHKEDRGSFTRSVAELEAESVAYIVCRHCGLDTEVRSSRYIALWDGNGKALRASLERIAKTARDIIDDAESVTDRKAVA